MTTDRHIGVRCPAKINTSLSVVSRRPDGYHELDTEFVSLELHDTLELEAAASFTLTVSGAPPGAVPVQGNLVARAFDCLQREVGSARVPGARCRLTKCIPAAAGLGGGSSDAAGALVGLVKLFELDVSAPVLASLALELGSDVPYFLAGGRCRGRGRGEILEALPDLPAQAVILVVSPSSLSTKAVFERHADAPHTMLTKGKSGTSLDSGAVTDRGLALPNDLSDAAFALAPDLSERFERCARAVPEGQVGLTGSGPTLFVLLPSKSDGRDAADRLRAALPFDVGVRLTRTTSAVEYQTQRFVGEAS